MSEKYFKKIIDLLEDMNQRMKKIEKKLFTEVIPSSTLDLLEKIPKSHLQTYFAVQEIGEASCTEVAEITGRTHHLESRYLVRLKELGMLQSKRERTDKGGSEVKYFIEEE